MTQKAAWTTTIAEAREVTFVAALEEASEVASTAASIVTWQTSSAVALGWAFYVTSMATLRGALGEDLGEDFGAALGWTLDYAQDPDCNRRGKPGDAELVQELALRRSRP